MDYTKEGASAKKKKLRRFQPESYVIYLCTCLTIKRSESLFKNILLLYGSHSTLFAVSYAHFRLLVDDKKWQRKQSGKWQGLDGFFYV
jgi:hypothetical protein